MSTWTTLAFIFLLCTLEDETDISYIDWLGSKPLAFFFGFFTFLFWLSPHFYLHWWICVDSLLRLDGAVWINRLDTPGSGLSS